MNMRAILLGAICTLTTPFALAEETLPIAGHWTFTARIDPVCSFGGTAALERTGPNTYQCELTARQSCPTLGEDFLVRQTCEASVMGNQVSVRSEIAEFINGHTSPYYHPDNFSLTIRSDTEMFGALVSSGSTHPAEWRRAEGGIS